MFDYDVLDLLSDRVRYETYHRFIPHHVLQPETVKIIKDLQDYYKSSKNDTVDWGSFSTYFWTKNGGIVTPTTAPVYRGIFLKMLSYTPSEYYDDLLTQVVELGYASQIQEIANDIVTGKSRLEDVDFLVKKALNEVGRLSDSSSVFAAPTVTSIIKSYTTSGYKWRLQCLNDSLGPLRKGDFISIAARIEVGKTTFLASEISYIGEQMQAEDEKRPIIWVNNEEQSEKVVFRIYQAVLCNTTADITRDPTGAEERYDKLVGRDRIRVTDGNINSVSALESLFVELNPALIVFDQLDKVEGFYKSEKEVERLGKLYKWARTMARTYGPVITASQLSADADDPSYKGGYEAMRGSKVDKPGELDVIMTLSKDKTGSLPDSARVINIAKNKMLGPLNESLRHAQHQVFIDEIHARYYD